jgi:hypothetical protein
VRRRGVVLVIGRVWDVLVDLSRELVRQTAKIIITKAVPDSCRCCVVVVIASPSSSFSSSCLVVVSCLVVASCRCRVVVSSGCAGVVVSTHVAVITTVKYRVSS